MTKQFERLRFILSFFSSLLLAHRPSPPLFFVDFTHSVWHYQPNGVGSLMKRSVFICLYRKYVGKTVPKIVGNSAPHSFFGLIPSISKPKKRAAFSSERYSVTNKEESKQEGFSSSLCTFFIFFCTVATLFTTSKKMILAYCRPSPLSPFRGFFFLPCYTFRRFLKYRNRKYCRPCLGFFSESSTFFYDLRVNPHTSLPDNVSWGKKNLSKPSANVIIPTSLSSERRGTDSGVAISFIGANSDSGPSPPLVM